MRRLVLAVVLVLAVIPTARAAEPEVVGGDWLVLDSVDDRARVPFNPDTLLRRYLLRRDAAPPAEGDVVRGTKDEPQTWKTVSADDEGFVAGEITLAYRAVESPRDRVVLAELLRGSVLVVNGTPYSGDIYGARTGPVPVALRAGENDVYVRGVRGKFRLTLTEPPAEVVVLEQDATLPDVVDGRLAGDAGAVVVVNCTTDWVDVRDRRTDGGAFLTTHDAQRLRIAPLGVLKVPVPLRLDPEATVAGETARVDVRVDAARAGRLGPIQAYARQAFTLKVCTADQANVRTFVSGIDGSVQQYALRGDPGAEDLQVVLSVHGAGVRCRGQAGSYSARPGVLVVAATNRRPFGFDWQDWGRTDAYEVLRHVLSWTGADRSRVCLTGHSMGGHGTWHLAANDPDGFAAIAPSAGWSQFDHYGRGDRTQAHREPWYGADAASDTLSLIDNLVQVPTYVLHGADDDNVPLSEAQRMVDALREAGAAPQVHFQEGVKHWWNGDVAEGADCVDWPPIFELFASSRIARDPETIRWTTVDPAVDPQHHWVFVAQPAEYGRRIRIEGTQRDGAAALTTDNAGLLHVRPVEGGALRRVTLDGTALDVDGATWFRRDGGAWRVVPGPVAGEKDPWRAGPFKRAFGDGFVLVVGTAGSDEEDRELMERARYDAAVWRYRGNGLGQVVTDEWFARGDAPAFPGRNVILYGNADTNSAWDLVFEDDCPIRARRGSMTVGRQTWESDRTAAVFVHRRRGDARALAAAFADTGPAGTRLHAALLPFVSGVGYPDYAVFSHHVLEDGDGGVLATGWFDRRWRIGPDGRR